MPRNSTNDTRSRGETTKTFIISVVCITKRWVAETPTPRDASHPPKDPRGTAQGRPGPSQGQLFTAFMNDYGIHKLFTAFGICLRHSLIIYGMHQLCTALINYVRHSSIIYSIHDFVAAFINYFRHYLVIYGIHQMSFDSH